MSSVPAQAQLEIQRLRLEVARLEHALTSAKLLAALLQPPVVIEQLNLTDRDREVLARLIEGDSNEQIAERLFIAMGTVKSRLQKLSRTFGTHNRTATVRAAIRAGFVPDMKQQEALP